MHSRFSSAGPPLLGVGHGQLIAWQVTVVLAAAAIIEHGPERWALSGVALALLVLTALRWRHRWAYQWLLTVWQLRRGRAARPQGRGPFWPGLPAIAVGPARIRGGREAGVAHDGDGFATVIAVAAEPDAPPATLLPVTALASLLDPADPVVSAVQVIARADLASGDAGSAPAASYRSLGYHRVPRSESAWIVLRHDPAASRYAVGAPGSARGRAYQPHPCPGRPWLAGRGPHRRPAPARSPDGHGRTSWAAGGGPAWRRRAGVRAPLGILGSRRAPAHHLLAQAVAAWRPAGPGAGARRVPALSVTSAVLMTRTRDRQPGLTATVRVTARPTLRRPRFPRRDRGCCRLRCAAGPDGRRARRRRARDPAARPPASRPRSACAGRRRRWRPPRCRRGRRRGAGRQPGRAGRSRCRRSSAEGATRVTISVTPALPRLLALRALGAGARLQVVTNSTAAWHRFRGRPELPPDRMTVAAPVPSPAGRHARGSLDDHGRYRVPGTRQPSLAGRW